MFENIFIAFVAASVLFAVFVLAACRVSGRCSEDERHAEDINLAALEGDLTAFVKNLNGKDAA